MNSNTIFQAYKEAHLQRNEVSPYEDLYDRRVRQEHKFAAEVVKRLLQRDSLLVQNARNLANLMTDQRTTSAFARKYYELKEAYDALRQETP